MLQKPGSGGGSSAAAYTSRRKVAQESPDDIIKKRSRLPANKKCCDCGSKLPNSVNLTVGAFLCLACAGIHRELPSAPRIKGIGHTVFTREEAEFLEGTDNDQINALYLAGYNPSVERLRMPTDNTDLHLLRTWINRKYKDKAWYREDGVAVSAGAGADPGGRGIAGSMRQPTMVANIPPKAAAPALDLFDSSLRGHSTRAQQPPPPPQPPSNGGWDAFGSAATVTTAAPSNQAFPADFGSSQMQNNNNFANFSTPQQSQPQPLQPQQSFPVVQSHPPANFASFEQQPQSATGTLGANGTFAANFPPASPVSMPQPHLISPQQQQQQPQQQFPPPSQNAFASFPSPYPSTNDSFGNVPAPQPQVPQQQHVQQQQQQQPQNFANFGLSSPTGTPQQPQQQHALPQGFATFSPGLSQQPTFPSVSQPPPSQTQLNGGPTQQSQQLQQPPPPQNDTASAVSALDKFDAFNSLNISPPSTATTSTNSQPSAENNAALNTSTEKEIKAQKSTYTTGQKVYYKSSSYCGAADILKVHFDDQLEPFYTIKVQGKEKQTDDKHLDEFSPLQTELHLLLSALSDDQMNMVKQYISQLSSAPSTTGASSEGLVSLAPPVPSLSSGPTPSGAVFMQPPSISSDTIAFQGPAGGGGAVSKVPQFAPVPGSGEPLSPHMNGAAFPSSQPTLQEPSQYSQNTTNSVPETMLPRQNNATMSHQTSLGGMMNAPARFGTGSDINGIPSPMGEMKPGISYPNGMLSAPMVTGFMPQDQVVNVSHSIPNPHLQVQFTPPTQHDQNPNSLPQSQQGNLIQPMFQQQMPPQQHQQFQLPHQQMPQQQFQQQMPQQQFQQQMPQQQAPRQQQQQQHQQHVPPQQQQQMQMPQQHVPPQHQQQQMPQQQQQMPPQQVPPQQQQQMSPKGNPFDYF